MAQSETLGFTYEDFDSGKVFEYLCNIKDPYEQGMTERRMAQLAKAVRFLDFKKLLSLYKQKQKEKAMPVITEDGISEFGEQEIELNTGEWHADENGVWKYYGGGQQLIACSHPIMPVRRMRSIDTGTVKYTLAYRRSMGRAKPWDYVDIDAGDMASPQEIVKKLAPRDISVTAGDRAKALVDYLRDMSDLNREIIPEVRSVSRMGWNEEGFSPYVSGIEFDGVSSFAGAYKAIQSVGDYDVWLAEARDARSYSTTAKIVLAASFASALVEPLGVLPFFVHLWSTQSGTGKSVGQMLGASVWGNPSVGNPFFPTFKSTSVGFEMMAGFLHSLPLFIDELQLAKDSHGKIRFNVYELAAGTGKLRSNKSLGLNYTPTWANCFITSGETPIVSETDGEGALNRVFEIECFADHKVINDGHKTANALKANYGHAGAAFIGKLMEYSEPDKTPVESIRAQITPLYESFYEECLHSNTTEKQAMAAATILTADKLATDWIFQDGNALTASDVGEFLKTKERISLMDRGYDIVCDWVSVNANRMKGIRDDDKGECYGIMDGDYACIIRSVFNRVCADNAINEKSLLSHLRSRGLIQTGPKGFTKTKRIGVTQVASCIWLKMPTEQPEPWAEVGQDVELPF